MSQVLSNLSFSLPSSAKITSTESRNFCFLKTNGASYNSLRKKNSSIKVVAADNRANLDHLQRASKHQQQTQPKKKVVPVAPPGLWDRFPTARTVQQMMETMERIMEDPYAYSGRWPSPAPTNESGYGRGRTPWEIKEGESEYKMRFDMPGMTKEDVKVWVEEKMLVVKAEKTPAKKVNGGENGKKAAAAEEEEEEEEEWSAKSYGRYSSRIALPENIQFEKIKAEVKDGVLYINIPKASTAGKILDIEVK
ncbi:small heat shock protein, chloroplastic [Manihot esculenta]|uniref:SHSP domain-containing protein n=1 Tax=Manihot esculenta TaxID=3983 RepID=A0A2C9UST0_MANES|nr:small heat shock protein, chloroplastic [Manihot esculenta]